MIIYDLFFLVFSLVYLPYLVIKGKAHKDFPERFGNLPSAFKEIARYRPVWIHAVSVGEVLAIKNFVEKFSARFPDKKIVFSTTTATGNAMAKKVLSGDILKFYFPLDFSFVIRRVVGLINPSALILMETEIWPNLILELSRRKIPVVLVNGRLSQRSSRGYGKIKFFFAGVLKKISLFCMQSAGDAERLEASGAPEENIRITGNMKFDVEEVTRAIDESAKSQLGMSEFSRLIIAGSTHKGEEEIVLDAYALLVKKFRDLKLIIAPRHIDRGQDIKRISEGKGFEAALVTEIKGKKAYAKDKTNAVIILDTLGELKFYYSLAEIVFMGGSLVKRGGHNLVEPALFGKPIIFGPHMFNFRDMARVFLESNAALKVRDKKELLMQLEELLSDKKKGNIIGQNAKELIRKSKGATERNINEIARFVK